VRGLALEPLHALAPGAALRDPELRERFALVDALRIGDARMRRIARDELMGRAKSRCAPEPRATTDVDVIVVVDSLSDYYRLSERLRGQGFREDPLSRVICRWRHGPLILDAMPTDESILGFSNRADERFEPGVAGALLPDSASQARRPIVMERFRRLAAPQ